MRPIEPHFSLDFTYALIFMQLVHITVNAVKQKMDKLKDREKWFVSGIHELERYRNTRINEQRMRFEIVFLSFFLLALRSNSGYGLIIHGVSRSHTTTHNSR
jgi:hypothetical protein